MVRSLRSILILLVCFIATWAYAHDPALSGIKIIVRKTDTVVSVLVHKSKLSGDIDKAIRSRLKLKIDGKVFAPDVAHIIDDTANDLVSWQAIEPLKGKEFEVASRIFPEVAGSRTVITITRDGVSDEEIVLDSDHPSWLKSQPKLSGSDIAKRYLVQGTEHILSGADHVLFVLGLLLLGGTLKSLIKTVTAFTIAHSITLSLAATGVFNPPSRIVEPLIALSIVAIAVENLRPRTATQEKKRDYRPLVAFVFGLVHGFGFAGALSEVGLTGGALAFALAMFNVGVECGQGIIVLIAAPLIAWIANRQPKGWKRFATAGSIAIAMIGGYWFITRIISG